MYFITIGILNALLGILIIKNPAFYSSYLHQYVDLTEIRWPFGGTLFILGCLFLWSSFRKEAVEAEKRKKEEKRVFICSRCLNTFYKKDVQDLICPKCGNTLEELSGFYERHPELKASETER